MKRILKWVLGEIWEKINFPATYRQIKELGKKHGKRFFWIALIWELIEDGVFPLISWWAGVPELIPLFWILHFEPIAYPTFFWAFRMWDRFKGREPWNPPRSAHSNYWRSVAKVLIYKIAIGGWFVLILSKYNISLTVIISYILLMSAFGFIHERVWHDSNYGIAEDDMVKMRRNLAKTATYRIVSTMIMYPLLRAITGSIQWQALLLCQATGFAIYLVFETVWSHSNWGVANENE